MIIIITNNNNKSSSSSNSNDENENNNQMITKLTKLNSVALVCERTIPIERPPPVGEVSANFCG